MLKRWYWASYKLSGPKDYPPQPNYPNPFNLETWIPFELSQDRVVTISIYDVQGQRIRRLQMGPLTAGRYVTADQAAYGDGKTEEGEAVASSTDFFRLKQKIIRKHERR